jgi:Fe(3+) dicitrate transport protein
MPVRDAVPPRRSCAGCVFAACLVAFPLCAARAAAQAKPDSAGRDSLANAGVARDTAQRDSAGRRIHRLAPTVVTGTRALPGVSRLNDDRAGHIYTGGTTTLLGLDSLVANTANNNYRQVLGRVPGANISETRGEGFPSDGVSFRGLDPRQSIEVNTRQNGINLAGDLYGYPETYYSPPLEAVDHIEVVRGASGLEYGPQFGGTLNYVLKDGSPNTSPTFGLSQTGASFAEYDGLASVQGGSGKLTYYAFGRYQGAAGWRSNSNFREGNAYGSVTYHASDALSTSLQLTVFRNYIHMAGGLDDSTFNANPQLSYRSRNWLASPWNILESVTRWQLSPSVTWTTTVSGMLSQRYLVWRNEDGGPQAIDSIDATTGQYSPREVEREAFRNGVLESRVGVAHAALGVPAELAAGLRFFDGIMHRQEGGTGTTGTDFNMTLVGPYLTDMHFGTQNVAGYAQEALHLTSRLTVTPGVRAEWLQSSIHGFTEKDGSLSYDKRAQTFALAGLGAEYALDPAITLYANITQAYRPITYDNLIPFGAAHTAVIDPHLHHSSGYTSDMGVRGSMLGGALSGDLNAFYLWYGDRIGLVALNDSVVETTNVANSRHYGIESYLNLDLLQLAGRNPENSKFRLSLYDSFAWVDAHYENGPYRGKEVEYASPIIDRVGPSIGYGPLSTTLTWSYNAKSFGDATNAVSDPADPSVGVIPSYQVLDWSARARLTSRIDFQFGVDNLTNTRYFTLRTGEYPGPGIIPGNGRTAYATFQATLR